MIWRLLRPHRADDLDTHGVAFELCGEGRLGLGPRTVVWIGALVLGSLLALLLIINAVAIRISGSRLEERLAAMRNAGEPVTLADLARPMPSPDENEAASEPEKSVLPDRLSCRLRAES